MFQKFEIRVLQRRNPELAHLIKFLKLADFLDESHNEFTTRTPRLLQQPLQQT